ncbi:hypothetical protein [Pseudoclavibacter sp. VKM Ac-2867]|uniref:hypothetical protein n=1 Tax=Pseudoclavibacter sp. VKM Ac-2867 TaxID=2783829 RepID=UPI00188A6BEC|nr:hypothetical protein [Pseudoclavibacter sp. VKM Ac-2867]MBF4459406.1 hypothetical protein [Pseudoclavibacter sp. VKM Ac-2867]
MSFPPNDPRGSFRFPDPDAFDGSLEEFHQFFSTQPIDDETLARVNSCYLTARSRDFDKLRREGLLAFENDDDVVAWFRAASADEVEAELDTRKDDYADAYAVRKLNERWSGGPSISPLKTRTYARVFQMVRLRGILKDPQVKEQLMAMPVPQSNGEFTYGELANRFRLSIWADNAFDR